MPNELYPLVRALPCPSAAMPRGCGQALTIFVAARKGVDWSLILPPAHAMIAFCHEHGTSGRMQEETRTPLCAMRANNRCQAVMRVALALPALSSPFAVANLETALTAFDRAFSLLVRRPALSFPFDRALRKATTPSQSSRPTASSALNPRRSLDHMP